MSPLVVVAAAIFCELLRRFRLLLLIQPLKRARYHGPLLDWTGGVHVWVWVARGVPGGADELTSDLQMVGERQTRLRWVADNSTVISSDLYSANVHFYDSFYILVNLLFCKWKLDVGVGQWRLFWATLHPDPATNILMSCPLNGQNAVKKRKIKSKCLTNRRKLRI